MARAAVVTVIAASAGFPVWAQEAPAPQAAAGADLSETEQQRAARRAELDAITRDIAVTSERQAALRARLGSSAPRESM